MTESNVVGLPRPGGIVEDDPLLGVLREGARRILMQAIQAEVDVFVEGHADLVDDQVRDLSEGGHQIRAKAATESEVKWPPDSTKPDTHQGRSKRP